MLRRQRTSRKPTAVDAQLKLFSCIFYFLFFISLILCIVTKLPVICILMLAKFLLRRSVFKGFGDKSQS